MKRLDFNSVYVNGDNSESLSKVKLTFVGGSFIGVAVSVHGEWELSGKVSKEGALVGNYYSSTNDSILGSFVMLKVSDGYEGKCIDVGADGEVIVGKDIWKEVACNENF